MTKISVLFVFSVFAFLFSTKHTNLEEKNMWDPVILSQSMFLAAITVSDCKECRAGTQNWLPDGFL